MVQPPFNYSYNVLLHNMHDCIHLHRVASDSCGNKEQEWKQQFVGYPAEGAQLKCKMKVVRY